MNKKELESVLKISVNKRYEYFIKKVVDNEVVWGLFDNGWAVTGNGENEKILPFWPKVEFAEYCAIEEWSNYKAKEIDLYEFIEKWLPNMENDGYKVSIFFNNENSALVEIQVLIADLKKELENY